MQLGFDAHDAWAAAVYGEPHPSTVQYLKSQYDNFVTHTGNAVSEFYKQSLAGFQHYNGSQALAFARSVIGKMTSKTDLPYIVSYDTLHELQNASVVMQRWLMANPTVRIKYQQQLCDGYSDTYIDQEPGAIGRNHYDYQLATNGMLEFDEDGRWKTTIYFNDLREGDRPLILEEKIAIHHSWKMQEYYMALANDDTTSNSGGKL